MLHFTDSAGPSYLSHLLFLVKGTFPAFVFYLFSLIWFNYVVCDNLVLPYGTFIKCQFTSSFCMLRVFLKPVHKIMKATVSSVMSVCLYVL